MFLKIIKLVDLDMSENFNPAKSYPWGIAWIFFWGCAIAYVFAMLSKSPTPMYPVFLISMTSPFAWITFALYTIDAYTFMYHPITTFCVFASMITGPFTLVMWPYLLTITFRKRVDKCADT
jgi:Kef-type K+ transport system membrane component KefB